MSVLSLPRMRPAFGAPGHAPRWTRASKDAIGTAYSSGSAVWFTLAAGVLNEVYGPTIDRPQVRDLQYLITDGESFFHDERRHLVSELEPLHDHGLGFRIISRDPQERYRIVKEVITDPHQPCVLVHTRLEGEPEWLERLRLFTLLAPHLGGTGWDNSGYVAEAARRKVLVACRGENWLALAATIPFARCSCGYVGRSDGWTDLAHDFRLDWEFDCAEHGNIALVGELDLRAGHEFTLGLSLGSSLHHVSTTLLQALAFPFPRQRERFAEQWARTCRSVLPLAGASGDGGRLYHASHNLLLAHEDKTYPGAMIASLSIPWGEAKGDEDLGGYHLVWTRDMVNSATGLLACGPTETALRALMYLACSQRSDGGFHQNFWIDGEPYWRGIQLDEVAFPILLAWRLHEAKALGEFDPLPLVLRAARYLIELGPATPQDRWEENSGYSPSPLAASIAGLTCAAAFASQRGELATADFVQSYADFLERHVEHWTVTGAGELVPGIPRHFIRLHPVDPDDPLPAENPDAGVLAIRNRAPGERSEFPAKDIVDAGFLELVRYGIRRAGDPLMEDSLRAVDAVLRVETPFGPCWRRYNHDGYGERADGGPFQGFGRGRAWPLLTGERGHYELAAGRDPTPYLRALEGFASCAGLLPEQVWDAPDRPQDHLFLGRPTGAAMPLMWAHAEYIKLLRSVHDGRVFDLFGPVAERYLVPRERPPLEVWKFGRRARSVPAGGILRLQAAAAFRLRWTAGDWSAAHENDSTSTAVGIDFVDLPVARAQTAPLRFTFFWRSTQRWEGRDFEVVVEPTP